MGYSVDKSDYYQKKYPQGTKLRLTADIDDKYTPKKAGDIFVVRVVDDVGQLHGSWDSGGSMAIVPEVDSFEIVEK